MFAYEKVSFCSQREESEETGYRAALLNSGGCGRPSYLISREQLVYFLRERFSRRKVADMLRVSLSTVARRIRENGLVNLLPYYTISEEDLEAIVRDGGRGLVSEETVVLRRWGSDTRKFGLSTELIM